MLCDPMGCGPQGSSLHRIVQARTLEWIAISSPRGSSRFRDLTHISYGSCAADRFFTTELPRKPFKLLIACCFCIIFKWPGAYIALQFSSLVSDSVTPLTAAQQASCPSPTPGVYSNSCPLSR